MKQRYTIPPDWCESITLTKESTFTSAFDKVLGTQKTSLPPQIGDQNNYRLPLNRSPFSLLSSTFSLTDGGLPKPLFKSQHSKPKRQEKGGARSPGFCRGPYLPLGRLKTC